MNLLAQAQALLADLLKDGPREAAQILAAAEGANIAWRTMQRAAESLGVVKTRVAFRSGWTWRLPVPEEPRSIDQHRGRAAVVAKRICELEQRRGKVAPIHALDPRVRRWAAVGVSDPDLREAYERAVFALRDDGPVTAGHLEQFVVEVMGGSV